MHHKKAISALICLAIVVGSTNTVLGEEASFTSSRDTVSSRQLVACPGLDAVYFIGQDGGRYVFPNLDTYQTWYPDFEHLRYIECDDLAKYPLRGVVPYQQGTRYLKLESSPTVYAVEPRGVLRAIPNEEWMEIFVGDEWAAQIDDLPDSLWSSYTLGEELDIREIPDGMTALDSDTNVWYYFADGNPKSLDGISFASFDNGHFRNFTRTDEQAPDYYDRIDQALTEASRIESEDEIYLGNVFYTDPDTWLEDDEWPDTIMYESAENVPTDGGDHHADEGDFSS